MDVTSLIERKLVLVELSRFNEAAGDLVERLIATRKENVKRFKNKISGLNRSKRFIHYGESFDLARKLESLLNDLRLGVNDPKTGVELVAKFFECDKAVLGNCDDSSGSVGDVYRHNANDLFVYYAANYSDKSCLCDLLIDLYTNDDYGVRDCLIEVASKFLSNENMRDLTDRFWVLSKKEKRYSSKAKHWIYGVEYLARQLGDAKLFEKAQLAAWPDVSTAACVDIAQVYLETGDAETALSWIQRISENEQFQLDERHKLLLSIHEKLGDQEKMADIAWCIFRRHRTDSNLNKLLNIIGKDEREKVIDDQIQQILTAKLFSFSDASFMIEVGRLDDVSYYILHFDSQLYGDCYQWLLPLAQEMEKAEYWLASYVIYKALLESILKRAVSKYYSHGVRYLKKLDKLSPKIADWQEVMSNDIYKQELTKIHFRKKAFWAKYKN